MKKMNIVKIVVAFLIVVVVSISLIMYLNKDKDIDDNVSGNENNENETYYGYAYYSGYLAHIDSNKNIIKTYSEFKDFCDKYNSYIDDGYGNKISGKLDDLLAKYDKRFFENKNLAIEYVELSSGSITVEFDNAIRIEDSISIKYNINNPLIGTHNMSGYFIIVEIDKEINNIL